MSRKQHDARQNRDHAASALTTAREPIDDLGEFFNSIDPQRSLDVMDIHWGMR